MSRPRWFIVLATTTVLATAPPARPTGWNRAPGVEVLLESSARGVRIVAARRRDCVRSTPRVSEDRASRAGVRVRVEDESARAVFEMAIGDPRVLPYDRFPEKDPGALPGLGVARGIERVLAVPLPFTGEARSVAVVGPEGEELDWMAREDLLELIDRSMNAPVGRSLEAAEAVPVSISGPSLNRLDLVFLGDGYTESDQDRFDRDVDACVDALFSHEIFHTYHRHLNVWKIPLVSAEAGADHPCDGVERDTALDATYDWPACLTRMMSYDYLKTWLLATRVLPAWDHLIVLVNDRERAGAMPPFAPGPVYSNQDFDYLTIHEWVGHGLARVMDEYDATEDVGPIGVPYAPNCSLSRFFPPWRHWIDAGEENMGVFKQCAFNNLYRPTERSCVMRELRPIAFDAFCRERAVKGLYLTVSPIDGLSPDPASPVVIEEEDEVEFEVSPLQPESPSFSYRWFLDGEEWVEGRDRHWVAIEGRALLPGSHTLEVEVVDGTSWVLKDRRALLEDRAAWEIDRP